MPLKEEALLIADYVSDLSTQISSGNTLTKLDEKWYLTSTDVAGFTESIASYNVLLDEAVLVIGSGATARAFVASCNADDRLQSGQVHVIHRNSERQKQMRAAAPNLDLVFHQWDSFSLINEMSLVVNTTPTGIADVFCDFVSKPRGLYFESLYNPWPTLLFDRWANQGGRGIDGIDLLVHQAISQVEIFSGKSVERKSLSIQMRLRALELLN
jgi:shikimate dehydrogenase